MSDEGPDETGHRLTSGEPTAEPSPAKPRRRKKRRRQAPSDEPTRSLAPGAEAPRGDDVDDRVPPFARGWPRDPELDALLTAFEGGEYARVRREAPALAARTEDDAVRRAARELKRRLDPDPVAVYMLLAAAALLVFLAGWYWLHPHTP